MILMMAPKFPVSVSITRSPPYMEFCMILSVIDRKKAGIASQIRVLLSDCLMIFLNFFWIRINSHRVAITFRSSRIPSPTYTRYSSSITAGNSSL